MENGRLTLRPATLKDAEMLWQWRNDPVTRVASHHSEPVAWPEHLEWLTRTLQNPYRQLLIAEEDGVPVGTVRADLADGVSELSWTVAPSARGRGIASRMVSLLADQIAGPIRAEVRVGNEASMRIAERAGMTFEREVDGVRHYARGPLGDS